MNTLIQLIPVAFRSLVSQKLRSLLSITGIVCGVLAVMAMLATGEGAKQKVLGELAGLGLSNIYIQQAVVADENGQYRSAHKSHGLTWSDIRALKKHPYIENIAGIKKVARTSLGEGAKLSAQVAYVSPAYWDITGKKIAQGRRLLTEDSKKSSLVCVLGADVSKALGAKGRVGEYLRFDDTLYRIVGILQDIEDPLSTVKEIEKENSNEMVFLAFQHSFMSRDDALQSASHNQLTQIIIKVDGASDVIISSEAIDRQLHVNHHGVRDYSMIVPRELLRQSLKTQSVFNIFLAVTGGISLFVGGIGIMNIMLANVSERRREIGIRRAVGATRYHIILQFLTESVLLTLVGALVGLLFGLVTVMLIEQVAGWPVQVTIASFALPFTLAIFAGIFFGLYPAIRAANLEPIVALKSL